MGQQAEQLFLDDFNPGQIFAGASRHITQDDVLSFAVLTGDKHPIHYDDDYAKTKRFGHLGGGYSTSSQERQKADGRTTRNVADNPWQEREGSSQASRTSDSAAEEGWLAASERRSVQ